MTKQNQKSKVETQKTTFTPGPWRVSGLKANEPAIEGANMLNGQSIGLTVARILGNKQREANARLIAAAPDLLGALETIYDCCKHRGEVIGSEWNLVKSAIAKARGGVLADGHNEKPARGKRAELSETLRNTRALNATTDAEIFAVHIEDALSSLDGGDCDAAIDFLKSAVALAPDLDARKQVEKAIDEAQIGSPEKAETLLEMLLKK